MWYSTSETCFSLFSPSPSPFSASVLLTIDTSRQFGQFNLLSNRTSHPKMIEVEIKEAGNSFKLEGIAPPFVQHVISY
jgi:hypothetical protein